MGSSLKLPQTAVLTLRAPVKIPLMEDSFEWYQTYLPLGDVVSNPDPTPAIGLLTDVLIHLIQDCGWKSHHMHIFGYGQGGTLAAELGIAWWRRHLSLSGKKKTETGFGGLFGSIISISGPLLSYPTLSKPSPTPLLIVHSQNDREMAFPAGAMTAIGKGYGDVTEQVNKTGGMPSSKEEWFPVMKFWSKQLVRRGMEGLHEIMSNVAARPNESPITCD